MPNISVKKEKNKAQGVLSLWMLLDLLSIPEATVNKDEKRHLLNIGEGAHALPWQKMGCTKAFVLQGGVSNTGAFYKQFLEAIGKTSEEVEKGRETRVLDLTFDPKGVPLPSSLQVSMSAWALGYLAKTKGNYQGLLNGGCFEHRIAELPRFDGCGIPSGFDGFDALQGSLRQWMESEAKAMRENDQPADCEWLKKLLNLVQEAVGLTIDQGLPCTIVEKEMEPTAEGEDGSIELCNFFAQDLKRVLYSLDTGGSVGQAMNSYLGMADAKAKIDVSDEENFGFVEGLLHPSKMPSGRWPSNYSLAFSQQLAVNAAWDKLASSVGLFGVNGPPGTGKTTMLRDVIAAVVTERAKIICDLGSKVFSEKKKTQVGDTWVPYYGLHSDIFGFSIVVASSNNGAVENITKELPDVSAVPETVEKKYFAEIAKTIHGKDAWGVVSAALGKRSNRTGFMSKFWWGEKDAQGNKQSALRDHLIKLKSPEKQAEKITQWYKVRASFKQAVENEKKCREIVESAADLPKQIAKLKGVGKEIQEVLSSMREDEEGVTKFIGLINHDVEECTQKINKLEALAQGYVFEFDNVLKQKPSFFQNILSFGAKKKQWEEAKQTILDVIENCKKEIQKLGEGVSAGKLTIQKYSESLEDILDAISHYKAKDKEIQIQLRSSSAKLSSLKEKFGNKWVDAGANQQDREMQQPWAEQNWLKARENLFLAALDLHKAFIEAHATQFIANLQLAGDWLAGKPVPHKLTCLALESLCMVVPVVSSTFASMPRMCARLGKESIGWLLIDEAGQAVPSHAASAIWRSKRVLVVGDPLQLEPVLSLPSVVESAVAKPSGVESDFWPSAASVQELADRATSIGTSVPNHIGGETWVGCPLRLHRRCDEPMFSISNAVAYAGQMVNGKKATQVALPESGWLDVQGTSASGNWISEEGAQLQQLLSKLLNEHGAAPEEIALISPFKDAAWELGRMARKFGLNRGKVGTVHTAQGKEADIVVLVLGGNPSRPGAKAWAASKPNLLNVAVSRAKQRLYVIGNKQEWVKLPFFEELSKI